MSIYRTFDVGAKVYTPDGLGELAYVRMKPPNYAEPEAVSVVLPQRKAQNPSYEGTIYRFDQVVIGPCQHYAAKQDNCTRGIDTVECHICGHTFNTQAWNARQLHECAQLLRTQNPDQEFVIDAGAVWLRHGGTDYGVYSTTILGGPIVQVMNFATGLTVLSRPTPTTPDDHS